jgi:hypothetical protein
MLWKELIRLISVEGQPTKAVVAQKCAGVFFFIKCLIQFLQCFFLKNRLRTIADHLANGSGPRFVKNSSRLNTLISYIYIYIYGKENYKKISLYQLLASLYKLKHSKERKWKSVSSVQIFMLKM